MTFRNSNRGVVGTGAWCSRARAWTWLGWLGKAGRGQEARLGWTEGGEGWRSEIERERDCIE
jgi:hypothetical protein